jgi:hypothetical protein
MRFDVRRAACVLALGAVWWVAADSLSAQKATDPGDLSVATRLDRTAVWIGDHFHYQITVDHAPTVQFVLENVNKNAISLDPFRVVDVSSSEFPLQDGKQRLFVDVTLASFATGVTEVRIPQLTLFYFRRDGAATATSGEGAAAESLTIPGVVVGIRSTLTRDSSDLRDSVTVSGWPRSRWIVAGIGWFALIALVAGMGWEAVRLLRQRSGVKGPDPRKAMAAIQKRWTQAVPDDLSTPAAVLDFYGRTYHDLKEYLGHMMGGPTSGLTAEEIADEMKRHSVDGTLAERAAHVLTICETARYGAADSPTTADAAREIADDMRRIFQTRIRR